MTIKKLRLKAVEIRKTLLTMIYNGKTGHTGGALSSADILTALFFHTMNIDAKNPTWEKRDRFILSKGHSVEGYYSVLADLGYFSKEELINTFSKFNSKFIGHPNNKIPGIEMNTGALGHGLSVGVGMAIGLKKDNSQSRVFVLTGDGELAEGSVWEAAMAGAHYKLDNLICIIDRNRLQISGSTEDVMGLEPLTDKWKSFGWLVKETDGNDMENLIKTLETIPFEKDKPSLIIANTIKGKGVKDMENVAKWHHGVPDENLYKKAIEDLDNIAMEIKKNG